MANKRQSKSMTLPSGLSKSWLPGEHVAFFTVAFLVFSHASKIPIGTHNRWKCLSHRVSTPGSSPCGYESLQRRALPLPVRICNRNLWPNGLQDDQQKKQTKTKQNFINKITSPTLKLQPRATWKRPTEIKRLFQKKEKKGQNFLPFQTLK